MKRNIGCIEINVTILKNQMMTTMKRNIGCIEIIFSLNVKFQLKVNEA